jgi:hypothetical protein
VGTAGTAPSGYLFVEGQFIDELTMAAILPSAPAFPANHEQLST